MPSGVAFLEQSFQHCSELSNEGSQLIWQSGCHGVQAHAQASCAPTATAQLGDAPCFPCNSRKPMPMLRNQTQQACIKRYMHELLYAHDSGCDGTSFRL
jgi:hypothetical protein